MTLGAGARWKFAFERVTDSPVKVVDDEYTFQYARHLEGEAQGADHGQGLWRSRDLCVVGRAIHMAPSRVYKVLILYFVSLRFCSGPQQARYLARIAALAEISSRLRPPQTRATSI